MANITIAENEYISVEYMPERGVIYHTVRKPIGGQPLREVLNAGADYLAANGVTKWLSDDRKNGPLPQADVEWGSNDWNQRMIDAGWKHWAMVVPTELHAADALSPVIADLYERGLRMRVFTNVESALEWLDSVD